MQHEPYIYVFIVKQIVLCAVVFSTIAIEHAIDIPCVTIRSAA